MEFSQGQGQHQNAMSQPVLGSATRQLMDQMNGIGNIHNIHGMNSGDVLEQLTSIFDILDLDGNGDLDLPEFKVGLSSIGINLTHEEAITLFESIDAEGIYYYLFCD